LNSTGTDTRVTRSTARNIAAIINIFFIGYYFNLQ
jgi:hypothetical protein